MSLKCLQLYGVITEILPYGAISVGEPIFSDPCTPNKYYRLLTEKHNEKYGISLIRTYPVKLEEVDISQYGAPVFLPAARRKVKDGKKYFVQFQPSKNRTVEVEGAGWWRGQVSIYIDTKMFERRDYVPNILTVGVKFPDKFVAVIQPLRFLTAGELARFIK